MYYGYYGPMVPDYRGQYDERFIPVLAPLTAGLIGLGIGYLGAEFVNRPGCCFYPPYGPGPGFPGYGYPGYGFGAGPGVGPGFGGYGYPGVR